MFICDIFCQNICLVGLIQFKSGHNTKNAILFISLFWRLKVIWLQWKGSHGLGIYTRIICWGPGVLDAMSLNDIVWRTHHIGPSYQANETQLTRDLIFFRSSWGLPFAVGILSNVTLQNYPPYVRFPNAYKEIA